MSDLVLWTANGALALLWLLLDHFWQVLCVVFLGYIALRAPVEQRSWTRAVCLLSLLSALAAPFPVALLTLLMALAGLGAVRLEKLHPLNIHWTLVRGLALYGLVGLGYAAYRAFILPAMSSDPALAQGQNYISAIASIALYLLPLGYLALLAQGLLVHPPLRQAPDEIVFQYRSRGKP